MDDDHNESGFITKRDMTLGLGVKAVEYIIGGVLGNTAFEAMKSVVVKRGERESRGMPLGKSLSVPVYSNACWYMVSATPTIRSIGFVIALTEARLLSGEESIGVAEDASVALKIATMIHEAGLPVFFTVSDLLVRDRDDDAGSAGGELV